MIAQQSTRLIPKRDSVAISSNINEGGKLAPAKYVVKVLYEKELVRQMNLEIK